MSRTKHPQALSRNGGHGRVLAGPPIATDLLAVEKAGQESSSVKRPLLQKSLEPFSRVLRFMS
ncbi:MAG: hypothetical protein OEM05_15045 [Myxococcales bacterium]|nr:hypothetical protein [Myxococcales bacterium]